MSSQQMNYQQREMMATGGELIRDPGASGTFGFQHKARAVCPVVTAAAESRALPTPTDPINTRLVVYLKTAGGALTITGSQDGSVVLDAAGEFAEFAISASGDTKQWRTVASSAIASGILSSVVQSLDLSTFKVHDAYGTAAVTTAANDDLGHTIAVIGTSAALLTSGNVSNASTVSTGGRLAANEFRVPMSYKAGNAFTIRFDWTRTDAAAVALTVDLFVYRKAAPTVDICATAAQSINAAASGTADFTITPTDLVPGETVYYKLTVINDDTAGGGSVGNIVGVKLVYVP